MVPTSRGSNRARAGRRTSVAGVRSSGNLLIKSDHNFAGGLARCQRRERVRKLFEPIDGTYMRTNSAASGKLGQSVGDPRQHRAVAIMVPIDTDRARASKQQSIRRYLW